MAYRFNPPPNWPPLPAGWTPGQGWQPPADWPTPPQSWQLWVPVEPIPATVPPQPSGNTHGSVFGARKRAQQAESQLESLSTENNGLRHALQDATNRNNDLLGQLQRMAAKVAELRGMDAVAMDREIRNTRTYLSQLTEQYKTEEAALGRQRTEASAQLDAIRQQYEQVKSELVMARRMIVETNEIALLQEAGIYEYQHRLAHSVAYKDALARLRAEFKSCAKNNGAIDAATDWTVNNSRQEGKRMVSEFSKLMLRAYNADADDCVRTMRPHRLATSIDRLNKSREVITRLGRTMHINVTERYHSLRLKELALTADYLAMVEEEKDRVRAERERQRDEKQARLEFEREKARLAKEMSHWQNALDKWRESGESAKVAEAEEKLGEISQAIKGVEEREANIRTGWVYVISNVGSFGQDVVKIGLTRRFDPYERVRELGDASVPFKFDVHALIFSADAVTLETTLHQRLTEHRVNRVNLRREFFRITPAEVLALLKEMELADNIVNYSQEPEALEWRTSRRLAGTSSDEPAWPGQVAS